MFRNQLLLILSGFLILSSCGKEVTYVCLEDDPPIAECCADDPTLSYCQPAEDMGMDGLNNPVDMADAGTNNPPDADNNQPDMNNQSDAESDADEDMPEPDMAPACLEACEGLTPVCDADSGNCVECLESSDCPDGVCQEFACVECALNSDCNNGVCHNSMCVECVVNLDCPTGACDVANNTCVECVSDATCSNQVCDTSAFECVDCLLDADCAGDELCKTQTPSTDNVCVQCLANTDCTSAASALCGPTNACLPCQAAADCAHIADANQCSEGTCVECTTATEVADCNNNVCNPATNTCTSTPIGTTDALTACVSDTQCLPGRACVPLNYMGAFHGNYCMPVWTSGSCEKPYGAPVSMRTSVSGQSVTVCMIKEGLTTPEAINIYEDSCAVATIASDCPAIGARCEIFDTITMSHICTYRCTGNNDCKPGSSCVGTAGNEYCGAE